MEITIKGCAEVARRNGIYSELLEREPPDDKTWRAQEAALKAEAAIPLIRPQNACAYSLCPRPAVAVWYRSAAELRAKSKIRMLPELRVCAAHRTPWRPWVALDALKPAEATKPKRTPRVCRNCGHPYATAA